jgi:trehalose 6-phosphate phosphatase
MTSKALPSALESVGNIGRQVKGKDIAVFLDYDGTLTPIVERPEDAVLPDEVRETLRVLARHCTVAVVSGRDLRDVRKRVRIDTLFYAGSHGFEISGPKGLHKHLEKGTDFLPTLNRAEKQLRDRLDKIEGAQVERKKFSIAVHYRRVKKAKAEAVGKIVDEVAASFRELRKSEGKKIYELQPGIEWNKGKALFWLLEELKMNSSETVPFYIGDDTTDEDAFEALKENGITIAVREGTRPTAAHYVLKDPREVQRFLKALTTLLQEGRNG